MSYWLEDLQDSHHSTKCHGHRHYGSGDVARSRDQRVMLLYGKQPVKGSYHPAKVGGHSHFGIEVIMNLVCHVILQDHVMKVSCEFLGGCSSW